MTGFWLKALALPWRTTPIAGLNAPADADGFAIGVVAGPIGQGSRGGVPIVKVGGAVSATAGGTSVGGVEGEGATGTGV